MSDEQKPSYEDLEILAMLALQVSHDLLAGDVENAFGGANVVKAYSFAALRLPMGALGFEAWEANIPFDARIDGAIARVAGAGEVLGSPYLAVLEQAREAYRELLAEEAKGAS